MKEKSGFQEIKNLSMSYFIHFTSKNLMSDDEEEDMFPENDSGEEYILEADDSDSIEFEEYKVIDMSYILDEKINNAQAYLYGFKFSRSNNTIQASIPTSVLPLSMLYINGFDKSSVLLELEFTLDNYSWTKLPTYIKFEHPIYKKSFIGSSLISTRISKFFSVFYVPRAYYKSQSSLFVPPGQVNEICLAQLVSLGYDIDVANRALLLTENNINDAKEYLSTGILSHQQSKIEISYKESPLIYLMLEITEAFLDLFDHCCVCGDSMGISGLKASICSRPMCQFSFVQLGVGANIVAEIRRDPLVADFLISMASACYNTEYLNPAPDESLITLLPDFFKKLPSVDVLARFENDRDLNQIIGEHFYLILRFIILSNRFHFITLPEKLKFSQCANSTTQFLALQATPEKELKFREKKLKNGGCFLWHGSQTHRWHSILHNGLKDYANTKHQVHAGPIHGYGVYQSDEASYSSGYSPAGNNNYVKSKLGSTIQVLSLVENIKGPKLNKVVDNEYTQQDSEGLIVRCVMIVHKPFSWNVIKTPPKHVPTLYEVLHSYIR